MNPIRSKITSVQHRLAVAQHNVQRKLIDNNLYWISTIVDCIRCKVKKSYEGDAISYICEKADVIHAVFPNLKDVPYRKIKKDDGTETWQLTSLITAFDDDAKDTFYSIQVPYEFNVDVDDLLFRVFIDKQQDWPIVIMMQVTELLGTFSFQHMIMNKCKCVIPTEDHQFPQDILDTMWKMAERRHRLGF